MDRSHYLGAHHGGIAHAKAMAMVEKPTTSCLQTPQMSSRALPNWGLYHVATRSFLANRGTALQKEVFDYQDVLFCIRTL